jgi:hypothetical protein
MELEDCHLLCWCCSRCVDEACASSSQSSPDVMSYMLARLRMVRLARVRTFSNGIKKGTWMSCMRPTAVFICDVSMFLVFNTLCTLQFASHLLSFISPTIYYCNYNYTATTTTTKTTTSRRKGEEKKKPKRKHEAL